jgi:hypothetical protein
LLDAGNPLRKEIKKIQRKEMKRTEFHAKTPVGKTAGQKKSEEDEKIAASGRSHSIYMRLYSAGADPSVLKTQRAVNSVYTLLK